MRIILSGGGTAGHVHPALAITEALKKNYPDTEILFIGRKDGPENKPMYDSGVNVRELEIYGLQRRLTLRNIRNVGYALKSRRLAKKTIAEFSPDVVLGTGGYVCWPVISAAASMKIPCLIHESNATIGLATRLLYKKCAKVLINHEQTRAQLNGAKEIITVGNPLRQEFLSCSRREARRKLGIRESEILIVSFGGSLGAEKINDCAIKLMKKFSVKSPEIKHIHATGRRLYSRELYGEYRNERQGCKILPYIDNMPILLHAADIVICRSGAVTLSELAVAGCPSILIPSPNVTGNHQYKNAKLLSDSGAAIMIEESNLGYEQLVEQVQKLCDSRKLRSELVKCIEKFAKPDSAEIIVDIIRAFQK